MPHCIQRLLPSTTARQNAQLRTLLAQTTRATQRKWQRGLPHRMQDYTITVVLNERSAGMSFSAPPHEPAQIALVGIAGVVERQPQLQHSAVVSAMLYDA